MMGIDAKANEGEMVESSWSSISLTQLPCWLVCSLTAKISCAFQVRCEVPWAERNRRPAMELIASPRPYLDALANFPFTLRLPATGNPSHRGVNTSSLSPSGDCGDKKGSSGRHQRWFPKPHGTSREMQRNARLRS
jgi:hypothetical protein